MAVFWSTKSRPAQGASMEIDCDGNYIYRVDGIKTTLARWEDAMAAILMPSDADRSALRRAGFEPDVAYMPVPRCDKCKWWERCVRTPRWAHTEESTSPYTFGNCGCPESKVEGSDDGCSIVTDADFGCVQWKANDGE